MVMGGAPVVYAYYIRELYPMVIEIIKMTKNTFKEPFCVKINDHY